MQSDVNILDTNYCKPNVFDKLNKMQPISKKEFIGAVHKQ